MKGYTRTPNCGNSHLNRFRKFDNTISSKQLFFSRICGPAAHDRVGDREITRKIKKLHAHVFTLSIFFPLFPEYLPIHSGGGKHAVCMGIESINLVCRVNN